MEQMPTISLNEIALKQVIQQPKQKALRPQLAVIPNNLKKELYFLYFLAGATDDINFGQLDPEFNINYENKKQNKILE